LRADPPNQIIFLDFKNPLSVTYVKQTDSTGREWYAPSPVKGPVVLGIPNQFIADVLTSTRAIVANSNGLYLPILNYTGDSRSDDALYARFAPTLPPYPVTLPCQGVTKMVTLAGEAY